MAEREDDKRTLEEIKPRLKEYVESITTKSKGHNMYNCPLCPSGQGKNKTGAFSVKGELWKCFSCEKSGDILDLIGEVEGISEYKDKIKRAKEFFNMTDNNKPAYQKQAKTEQKAEKEADYSQFYLEANKNINNTNYHRGITLETLNKFKVGYIAEWRHPKAPQAPATPRLIIPTSKSSYLARDTRENIPEIQKSYSKSKVGKTHIFNIQALNNAKKPIFIVEGELDALSIIDAGGEAIGLGSISMIRTFISILEKKKPEQALVIALDNDERGQEAARELENNLKALNIAYYKHNPAGVYKDPNEALQANREAFKANISVIDNIEQEKKEELKEEYTKNAAAYYYLQDFINGIAESANTPAINTGFNKLDEALGGGLYEGLYCIGAISSIGKTTLVMQIADQIAEKGQDVLIFSLEMSRNELIARSISRHTLIEVTRTGGEVRNAKTARGITTGKRYEKYSNTEKELITEATKAYGEYAKHIYIKEGIGDLGVKEIKKAVDEHIYYTGNRPVVIVDYLQILAPYNDRLSEKQNTDKAVIELKRISRDNKIPVIVISSFNRNNYSKEASEEAFKESGGIEYSSDVLIALQLKGVAEGDYTIKEAKKKDPREIELVIIKQRNGEQGITINYSYYPMFNLYIEE